MKRYCKHLDHYTLRHLRSLLPLGVCLYATAILAQPAPSTTSAGALGELPTLTAPSQWSDLDSGQQQALYPLKKSWTELSDIQRRKWIAIIKNFPTHKPEDQVKLQERMSAWAALNPLERERARENFASSKLAKPSTKAGSWEEYRALPQEEREKLASQTTKKRPSAAKSSKPLPPVSLVGVSSQPNTNPAAEERLDLRNLITPDTLLPRNLPSLRQ